MNTLNVSYVAVFINHYLRQELPLYLIIFADRFKWEPTVQSSRGSHDGVPVQSYLTNGYFNTIKEEEGGRERERERERGGVHNVLVILTPVYHGRTHRPTHIGTLAEHGVCTLRPKMAPKN